MGDFNVNLTDPASAPASDLTGLMSTFSLSQLVEEPTHCTSSTSTIIDHIYVNNRAAISHLSVGQPLGSSDHNCTSEGFGSINLSYALS